MGTRIEGQCVLHKVITDECRRNRTDDGAWAIVREELTKALMEQFGIAGLGRGFKFHVVLTSERPRLDLDIERKLDAALGPEPERIQSANGNQCCPSCGASGPCECPELI